MILSRSGDGDRRRQVCECCICHEVSLCTPANDFYTTPQTGDRLVCSKCFITGRHLHEAVT